MNISTVLPSLVYTERLILSCSPRIPLTDVDFGYEGKSRFYIYEAWERYLRLWQDNPTKRADGTWEPNQDGVRVFFRVKSQYKNKLLKMVEEDMRNVLSGN